MRIILVLLTLLIWQYVLHIPSAQAKPTIQLSEESIIKWLPPNVETLVVARKPYRYRKYSQKELDSISYLDLRHLPGAPPILTKSQINKTILLNIEAARDFRYPGGNDSTIYEGCHICLFEKPHNIDLDKYSDQIHLIEGFRVAQKQLPVGFGSMESFVAIPMKNLTIWTTSKQYMQTVLRRMKSSPEDRAMPKTLAEWRGVKQDAKFYAIRHYSKASQDDMSPYSKASIWNNHGYGGAYKAEGFSFSTKCYRPSKIDFWFFSSSPKDIKTIEIVLGRDAPDSLKKKQLDENTWMFSVRSESSDRWYSTIINLFALLGHTPYF